MGEGVAPQAPRLELAREPAPTISQRDSTGACGNALSPSDFGETPCAVATCRCVVTWDDISRVHQEYIDNQKPMSLEPDHVGWHAIFDGFQPAALWSRDCQFPDLRPRARVNVAGGLIRNATFAACLSELRDAIDGYWERLAAVGADAGILPRWPLVVPDEATGVVEVCLGAKLVRKHEAMATFEEVGKLRERSEREGMHIGLPPTAVVLGIQHLNIHKDGDEFVRRTKWYKYCLLLQAQKSEDLEPPGWFALRMESDPQVADRIAGFSTTLSTTST